MNIQIFIDKFSSLFEVTRKSEINATTRYKSLEEWDSLMALETIAMVDEEFNTALDGNDIRNADTVEDLYGIIKSRTHG